MAGFIYYWPGKKGVTRDELEGIGLERVFMGAAVSCGEIDCGPDKGAGCLFAVSGDGRPRLAYKAAEQVWNEYQGFWLGYDKEGKPGPDGLARAETILGYIVTLSDGQAWNIPSAPALPSYLGVTATGARAQKTHPDFATLSEMGARVMGIFEAANEEETTSEAALTPEEEADICLECLATNYRIGIAEADALCLLTDIDRQRILFSLIDILNQDAAKKKDASGSGSPE